MPSMQAPARPRRLTRRMQRTRGSSRRDFLGEPRRAVGAVVVHDDHFPRRLKRGVDAPDQFAQIAAFVEGGNDEGEFDGQGRKFPFVRQIC